MLKKTMSAAPLLDFLRNKVIEIRSALFFNVGGAPYVYSSGIISALDMDLNGNICFYITRPNHLLYEDRRFAARLDFYRKGKPFFMKVHGIAELIVEQQELNKYFSIYSRPSKIAEQDIALVKLKVEQVEYYQPNEHTQHGLLKRFTSQFTALFSTRPYIESSLVSIKIV